MQELNDNIINEQYDTVAMASYSFTLVLKTRIIQRYRPPIVID